MWSLGGPWPKSLLENLYPSYSVAKRNVILSALYFAWGRISNCQLFAHVQLIALGTLLL